MLLTSIFLIASATNTSYDLTMNYLYSSLFNSTAIPPQPPPPPPKKKKTALNLHFYYCSLQGPPTL